MSNPTAAEMINHPARVACRTFWENMNFVAQTRQHLLRGEVDLDKRLRAQTLLIHAVEMARRNHCTAKCYGFRLPG